VVQPDDSVKIVLGGPADEETAWRFTPDAGAQAIVDDADYLVFGVWLTEPVNTAATRDLVAFADGSQPFTADEDALTATLLNALTGKATYSGPASGYYAKRLRRSTQAAAGRFTATATLKADFNAAAQGTEADAAPGTISGSVTDFVILNPVDGIVASNPNWSVALKGDSAVTTDAADIVFDTGTVSANIMGITGGAADGIAWSGDWGAQFFGNTKGVATALPTGMAGVFQAQAGMAAVSRHEDDTIKVADPGFVGVVGAFGAELQD
jgi:hypothetical protein